MALRRYRAVRTFHFGDTLTIYRNDDVSFDVVNGVGSVRGVHFTWGALRGAIKCGWLVAEIEQEFTGPRPSVWEWLRNPVV